MIVGLTGYKGTGKSTVAEYLAKEHGFKRVNFKDGLVAEITDRFPALLAALAELYGYASEKELFHFKPTLMRALLQEYGTEVRRAGDENYWVDKWKAKYLEIGDNVVADDVRFDNEFKAVKDWDGIVIRVTRPDITTGGSHQSETEQENFVADFTIVGEPGDHASIYRQVDEIINTLKTNTD